MNLAGYCAESITEGDGMRAVFYISGCRHACPGCQNVAAQDFTYGRPFTPALQDALIAEVAANPLLDGITLCGGDPFFSAGSCAEFVRRFRAACPVLNVWAYTGYTYEALLRRPDLRELAELCDVIVDGRYVEAERDLTLKYRGSRNQRIIRRQSGAVSD
jgi:anaerobic ribonucleoside-triphosphate reductase activating protein